jgi:hypothetical protein
MTAEECHQRASTCAANAALAVSEPMALEFIRLAAQWRAMASRAIYLGPVDDAIEAVVDALGLPFGPSGPLRPLLLR